MFRRAGPLTIGDLARDYVTYRDCKTGTVNQYRIAARRLEEWAGRGVLLAELNEGLVSEWLREFAGGASASTVRGKRAMIMALWRTAADEGLCEPPTRRVRVLRKSTPRPAVEAWTIDDVDRLLSACRRLKRRHRCGLSRAMWFELAVRVAWDSGLRWRDLVSLEASSIAADGRCTVVQGKTGRLARFRLSGTTRALLQETMRICPRELVCPWPASQQAFGRQVRRLVAAAGIRPGTWRWIRRASGTDVEIQRPGSGSVHLGHAPGSRVFHDHYGATEILDQYRPAPRALGVGFCVSGGPR
jgi:integrase